jgi:hypothetical protein
MRPGRSDLSLNPMGKSRDKHPFEDNPFADDLLEWMGSAEGQAHIEMSDVLWALLKDVRLDAVQRKLVWPDAERLSFDESVQRICKQHADFDREEVGDFLLSWLENYGLTTTREGRWMSWTDSPTRGLRIYESAAAEHYLTRPHAQQSRYKSAQELRTLE